MDGADGSAGRASGLFDGALSELDGRGSPSAARSSAFAVMLPRSHVAPMSTATAMKMSATMALKNGLRNSPNGSKRKLTPDDSDQPEINKSEEGELSGGEKPFLSVTHATVNLRHFPAKGMMFDQFLLAFQNKLKTAGLQDALDFVFGYDRKGLDLFRPGQKQTRDFVDELQAAVFREDKELSKERGAALSKVLVYNERPGRPCFAGIDPHVFAFQLALRIREPSLINQRHLGVCGENAMMIAFAKRTPSAFGEYAISLMSLGSGEFYG